MQTDLLQAVFIVLRMNKVLRLYVIYSDEIEKVERALLFLIQVQEIYPADKMSQVVSVFHDILDSSIFQTKGNIPFVIYTLFSHSSLNF
jgi:hypothetical protein